MAPVSGVSDLATMRLGSELLLCANLTFAPGTTAEELVRAIDRVEAVLKEEVPEANRIYLEADGLRRP